jgi:hypothetical protein
MTLPTFSQADQDAEHLRLLSIFHYIVAGFQALSALLPVFHLVIGLGLVFAPEWMGEGEENPLPAQLMGGFFALFAGAWILAGLTMAACLVIAGRALAQRKRRTFCLVIAGLTAATCMPLGTVLGVFTIVVLSRPSVVGLFATEAAKA